MTFSLLYWIIMLVWFLFGVWSTWPNYRAGAPNLILFILLILLGWRVFGPPVHS